MEYIFPNEFLVSCYFYITENFWFVSLGFLAYAATSYQENTDPKCRWQTNVQRGQSTEPDWQSKEQEFTSAFSEDDGLGCDIRKKKGSLVWKLRISKYVKIITCKEFIIKYLFH